MVNVAGRSRGCQNCRLKRKGCDLQRPKCGRCQREAVTSCEYGDSLHIVQYQHHGHGATRYTPAFSTASPNRTSNPPPNTLSNQALDQAAVETGLVDFFCRLNFPSYTMQECSLGILNQPLSIIFHVRNRWRDDRLIKIAMRAVVFSALGRQSDEPQMSTTGIRAYQEALSLTNRLLQDPQQCKTNRVLAACKMLAIYEQLAGSGFNWERHTWGISRILYIRGPSRHADDLAHYMFLDSRNQTLITAIIRREYTFLSQSDWKHLPWTKRPKDLRQELNDIMLELPTILAGFDIIKASGKTDHGAIERVQRLVDRCQVLLREAHVWLQKYIVTVGVDLWAEIQEGIPQTLALDYFGLSHALTLFWTTNIHLYNIINLSIRLLPAAQPLVWAQHLPMHDPGSFALRIVSSTGYFLQPGAGPHAAAVFSFPMGAAFQYLAYSQEAPSEELRQAMSALKAGKMGQSVAHFLRTLQANSDPMKTARQDEDPDMSYRAQKSRAKMWYEDGKRPSAGTIQTHALAEATTLDEPDR